MKSKTVRECRLCGESFTSTTSFGIHIAKAHDVRPGGKDVLPLRPVSCWRCAGEININETEVCECGFVFPTHLFPSRK